MFARVFDSERSKMVKIDLNECQWNEQVNVHILGNYIIVMLVYFHVENEAFTTSLIKNCWNSLFSIWKQKYRIANGYAKAEKRP